MKLFFRVLKYFGTVLIVIFLYNALVVAATINGWWYKPITSENSIEAFVCASEDKINSVFVGNFAMSTFKGGAVETEEFHSVGEPVNRNTVFQVASLSKWVSAFGIMKLVESGKLELDVPISSYLTRWQLPESEFDNSQVTVRRLLSHTAGLTDGLGYSGFEAGVKPQSLEESLTMASDADEGISGVVKVGMEPGSFKYSGGGYTLLQLIVEEVSGQSFASYMKQNIFEPLNMKQSTYVLDQGSTYDLVEFYNKDGSRAKHYRYTSLAATSLYTSLSDLELFFQVFLRGKNNEPIGRNVLRPETLVKMRKAHAKSMGADIWGLGTMLYTETKYGDYVIGHDGQSIPAINTAVRLNPETGNGIIILETGHPILATKLASEWVFWKIGSVDILLFSLLKDDMISNGCIGTLVIIIISTIIAVVRFRRKKTNEK